MRYSDYGASSRPNASMMSHSTTTTHNTGLLNKPNKISTNQFESSGCIKLGERRIQDGQYHCGQEKSSQQREREREIEQKRRHDETSYVHLICSLVPSNMLGR